MRLKLLKDMHTRWFVANVGYGFVEHNSQHLAISFMAVVDFDIIDIRTHCNIPHPVACATTNESQPPTMPQRNGLCDGVRVYALCTRLAFTFPCCYCFMVSSLFALGARRMWVSHSLTVLLLLLLDFCWQRDDEHAIFRILFRGLLFIWICFFFSSMRKLCDGMGCIFGACKTSGYIGTCGDHRFIVSE